MKPREEPVEFCVGGAPIIRRDHRVDARFRFVRQRGLTELEVALVFAQDHLIDEAAIRLVHRFDAAADFVRRAVRRRRGRVRRRRRLRRSGRLLIDLGDAPFVPALLNTATRGRNACTATGDPVPFFP